MNFRNLNKVISNEGWKIPNMKEMIERIEILRPSRSAIADLTSGLPSILYFDLLSYFQSQMSRHTYCEMCAVQPPHPEFKSPVAQIGANDFAFLNVNEPQRIPHPCTINIPIV